MENKLLRRTMKQAAPGLLYTLLLYLFILIVKPNLFLLLAAILTGTLINYLRTNKGNGTADDLLATCAKTTAVVLILITIVKLLGPYGLLGFIATILIISAYILIKARHQYLFWIRTIERQIWGETLEDKRKKK